MATTTIPANAGLDDRLDELESLVLDTLRRCGHDSPWRAADAGALSRRLAERRVEVAPVRVEAALRVLVRLGRVECVPGEDGPCSIRYWRDPVLDVAEFRSLWMPIEGPLDAARRSVQRFAVIRGLGRSGVHGAVASGQCK